MRRRCLVLLALLVVAPVRVAADDAKIVVLPFANLTGRHAAFERILPEFYVQLGARGADVVRHDEIRGLLREHRIRALGQIGRRDARLLREETGARLAILGSLDIYRPELSFEVNVSARVLDLETLEIRTAASRGLTVQETESWFAVGRAPDVETVMRTVVASLVEELAPHLSTEEFARDRYHTCGLVAVVPLDDYSNSRYAAEVVQNLLVAELVTHDWSIVEPGFVREILLDEQRVARGGVSREVREILRRELGVCWVITGDLAAFEVSPSGQEAAVPHLNFALRLIDARQGGLRATIEVERDGSDGEGLFGMGREYSMARLTRVCTQDVAEWMRREAD